MELHMTVSIALLVMSGASLGSHLGASFGDTSPSYMPYELTVDIVNRKFNDSLLDPKSPDYQMLYTQVNGALYSIFGCFTCSTQAFYNGISAMTFSDQHSSVLAKSTLWFEADKINADIIKALFRLATFGKNLINGLKLDPYFTHVKPGPTKAPNTIPVSTPTMPHTTTTKSRTIVPSETTRDTTPTMTLTTRAISPSDTPNTTVTTARPTTEHRAHHSAAPSLYPIMVTFLCYTLPILLILLIF